MDDHTILLEEAEAAGCRIAPCCFGRRCRRARAAARMTENAETSQSSDDLAWRWHDNLIYGMQFTPTLSSEQRLPRAERRNR